ncbi:unnamed protein product [Eruca vesicaria subsp. sativa]|uniref:Uncharacterized protein n=1 Tax=Eruca vesicaria subsp. sativa TaxID=29727 RepID=A0ABC8LAT8_ERUVS|nr:unnamed protein product [Eruca vesicaria subsp. sativa]
MSPASVRALPCGSGLVSPQSKLDLCSSLAVGMVQISDCGLSFFSRHQHLDPPQVFTSVTSLYPCAFSREVMLTVQVLSSRKLCCIMWVSYSYLNQRGLIEVDWVFGLRLLGLCALVASYVLSRIGLVQVVCTVPSATLLSQFMCAP